VLPLSGSKCAAACTSAKSSTIETTSQVLPYTSGRASLRWHNPTRFLSAQQCATHLSDPIWPLANRGTQDLRGVPGHWQLSLSQTDRPTYHATACTYLPICARLPRAARAHRTSPSRASRRARSPHMPSGARNRTPDLARAVALLRLSFLCGSRDAAVPDVMDPGPALNGRHLYVQAHRPPRGFSARFSQACARGRRYAGKNR
jgi:hypothetical protein